MVNRTIGDNRCQCIFSFEKHYLMIGIDKQIEDTTKQMDKIKELKEKITLARPEQLLEIHGTFLNYILMTKQRLENTPVCDTIDRKTKRIC